jgi:hypothetical protein
MTRRALGAGALALTLTCGACASGHSSSSSPRPHGVATTPTRAASSGSPVRLAASVAHWRLPTPLSRAVAFTRQSQLVVAGGLENGDVSTQQVLTVAPASGAVTRAAPLANAVHDAAGIALGGRDLVVGGGSATITRGVQQLGTGLSPARVVGKLPTDRADVSGIAGGGVGYIVGGYDGTSMQATVLSTKDGRHFHPLAALPVPVRYAAVAVTPGALWVVGGRTTVAGTQVTDVVQRVDLRTRRASIVARLPYPLSDAAAVLLDGRVLICGGDRNGGASTRRVLQLDTATGRVHSVGRLAFAVADEAAVVVGSGPTAVGYLLGGEARGTRTARVQNLEFR